VLWSKTQQKWYFVTGEIRSNDCKITVETKIGNFGVQRKVRTECEELMKIDWRCHLELKPNSWKTCLVARSYPKNFWVCEKRSTSFWNVSRLQFVFYQSGSFTIMSKRSFCFFIFSLHLCTKASINIIKQNGQNCVKEAHTILSDLTADTKLLRRDTFQNIVK
jgi:hypothetical protein